MEYNKKGMQPVKPRVYLYTACKILIHTPPYLFFFHLLRVPNVAYLTPE